MYCHSEREAESERQERQSDRKRLSKDIVKLSERQREKMFETEALIKLEECRRKGGE